MRDEQLRHRHVPDSDADTIYNKARVDFEFNNESAVTRGAGSVGKGTLTAHLVHVACQDNIGRALSGDVLDSLEFFFGQFVDDFHDASSLDR